MSAPDRASQIKGAVAAVLAFLTALWGWLGWAVLIWLVCLLLDYVSGTAAARRSGDWSSAAARDGLWHKLGEIFAVAVAALCVVALVVVTGMASVPLPFELGALVTPVVMLLGGLFLFGSILSKQYYLSKTGSLGVFSYFIVQVGLAVMILGRSGKMSFFDMSKEIAFIPLSDDLKAKGKAFVDGMGHRFGKSFGSGFQVLILTIIGSISNIPATYDDVAPYAFAIYMLLTVAWIFAVFRLNRRIENGEEA